LEICIYKTLLLHRLDDVIDFTLNCPPHILQQNRAHGCNHIRVLLCLIFCANHATSTALQI